MNERAAGDDTAASSSIASLHELAQGLRAQLQESQAGARLPNLLAQLQVANARLMQAALQAADRVDDTIRHWGAAAAAETVAATKINDQRSQDLQEANERLVLATFKAQDLEHQAEATNRQQVNFMAILAHELRNPVAPIRHAIKILDNDLLSEEQHQWSRGVIRRQVEHMARLLDDLLDSARLTSGDLKLRLAPATLLSIVTDALDAAMPLIEKKQHTLEVNLPKKSILLCVDAVRISQVLSNLLINAAKYSDLGGRIAVTATIDTEHVAISVLDAGVGLQAEVIPSLFLMFSQLQSTLDRAEGGLGLGLAFANELMKLHGGRIEVRSEGEGFGSEFTVLLPSSVVLESTSTPPESKTMIPNSGSLRILIADDNIDAAESLSMILEMAGHEMLLAHDGMAAVEIAEQLRPQVAIIDIGMPMMNGYLVAEKIRSAEWGKEILLIALTGWGQSDDKARASAAGFDHHFTKPVDSDLLEALIAVQVPPSNADKESAPTTSSHPVNGRSGEPPGRPPRSLRPLGLQSDAAATRVVNLLEANEHLVLAALNAEITATTAEHNLSELARNSQRDGLTDTPNRALMLDRLENAIAMAQRHNSHVAVLFVDLDYFKRVNDTGGHARGDAVLQRTARCLESTLRASDTVGRYGGDEFLVLLTEVSKRPDAAGIAAKMLMALTDPAHTSAELPPLSASIGISVYPEDGTDAQSLITRADTAMYRAKKNGRNRFEFYAGEMDSKT